MHDVWIMHSHELNCSLGQETDGSSVMAVQDALAFIRMLRVEVQHSSNRPDLISIPDLATLTKEAAQRGFKFSTAELRQAHLIDYRMRACLFANLNQRG